MPDTTRPRGTLSSPINFSAPTLNPYGLADVGDSASPSFVDIDADGDLDALMGNNVGNTVVQLNTGSATRPAFAAATTNPYGLVDVGNSASPSFVDIDADGDLDALIGNNDGNTLVQLNTGSPVSPAFAAPFVNPYSLVDVGSFASPSFVDIDGDGDLDALIGNRDGNTVVQLNTGSATSPAFAAAITNPYGLADVGGSASPSFVDIDFDGDLDVLIGNGDGNTLVRMNTGSVTSPAFAAATTNPYGLADVGLFASPSFVDIDGDGDLDALIGNGVGNTVVHLNITNPAAPVTTTTANGSYGVGSVITLTVAFNEAVLVTGTPTLLLETGATNRNATYSGGSGSTTLSFSYTVRAGDTSGDLDVVNYSALKLNGGTIRDAAGNNAILALAPPGATGSLGANANIVIDSVAPRGALLPTPAFAAPATNPYSLATVGASANPSFVDIDDDGDLDALIGNSVGNTLVQLNTGSNTAPAFAASTTSPYGLADVGNFASPGFVDIDADGDLDALVGNGDGNTLVQLNTGSASSPAFAAAMTNPFGLVDVGTAANPNLIDIDGDGDLDALIGNGDGNTLVQLNTGNNANPAFATPTTNPYGLVDVGSSGGPSFVDIDADGDLDALIGERFGNTLVQLNTGSATSPAFAAATLNAYGLADAGFSAKPNFVDIDGDGDLDALIGNSNGHVVVQLNTGNRIAPVTSTNANGTYGVGSVITLTVAFNEAVIVTGTPTLLLETGATDRTATYSGGSGTNTLSFQYTVQVGDTSADLDQFSSSALALNGGTIADAVGNNAVLTLAAPGAPGSLGASKALVLDGVMRATVTSVNSSTPNGAYKAGDVVSVQVNFSEIVTVTGTPQLTLETGTTDRVVNYASGSGTSSLTFNYTVQAGDAAADLDFISTSALALNGGTIRNAATNDAVLTLAAPGAAGSLGANKAIVINTTPSVISVTSSTANGSYIVGDAVSVQVNFSNVVTVTGTPSITLETGSTDRAAVYTSGSGTSTLTFSYTVRAGDISADLDVVNSSALKLDGGTIRDAFGANATLTLAAPGAAGSLGANASILIDGVAPRTLLPTPAFATATTNPYGLGSVGSSASPSFVDIDDDGDLDAFIGTKGGNIVVQLNTGSATSPAFAAATTNPYGLAVADSWTSPSFVDIDGDGDLDAFIGNRYGNTVVQLNTGSATSPAFAAASTNPYGLASVGSYASPSLVDIDGDGDLDALIGDLSGNTAVQLNTGSATGPAFAAATTNPYGLADAGRSASPSFVDIDDDGDLDALIGNSVGNTLVQLNTGSATSPAFAAATTNLYGLANVGSYASPSFVDIDGDGDLDALIGNGGGNTVVQLNTANPVAPVTSATANGSYGVGSVITLKVVFTEAVLVTGTPSITLETGSTDRAAVFTSGSGSTTLTFSYTVQAGDTSADLDVVNSSALKLNGGTVKDAAGNNAILTLAAPGTTSSLGANANIVIDSVAPRGTLLPAPAFAAPTTNPYGLADAGVHASPRLVDIDGDGDLDALIGNLDGNTVVQLNTGSPTAPAFSAATLNPYGLADVGLFAIHSFVDIDGDGDLDALIGNNVGNTVVQLNTGSATSPAFAAATTNPYGLTDVGSSASPSFVDIDGDGDLDALIGELNGNTVVQLNTGSATSPAFAAATTNPYGLTDVGGYAIPSLVDMDGDGDLDALIGELGGNTVVQLNTGSATSPAFAAATLNPYGLADVGNSASPSFVDIDGDGDLLRLS